MFAILYSLIAFGVLLLARNRSVSVPNASLIASPKAPTAGSPTPQAPSSEGEGRKAEGEGGASGSAWYFRAPSSGLLELTASGASGLRQAMTGWTGMGPASANDGAVDAYLFLPRADGPVKIAELLDVAKSTGRIAMVNTLDLDGFKNGSRDPSVPVMVGLVKPSDLPKLLTFTDDAGHEAKDLLVVVG